MLIPTINIIINLINHFQKYIAKWNLSFSSPINIHLYIPLYLEANFPVSVSRLHISGTMYFTGFTVTFDNSCLMTFEPYPPNFILGENSFCFLKFPISDFSNLGDSHSPFGGIWGIRFFPKICSTIAHCYVFILKIFI